MRCVPSAFPLTTTIWHGDVSSYWNVSVKVSGGPASRMYCLGPKATVIGAAGTCKVRTVEVSVTEESRNNRLDNKSLLFMGTSRENPAPGLLFCLVGYPRIAHTANPIPRPGVPDFLQIRMGKGFSSTNFVHWINGVVRVADRLGPSPTLRFSRFRACLSATGGAKRV